MSRGTGLLWWVVGAGLLSCGPQAAEPSEPSGQAQASSTSRPQPKPGERVRQPELDGYCAEQTRPDAFYYHGGRPVVRVARQDGCTPLFVSECADAVGCDRPREQEAGMWCCAAASATADKVLREARASSPH